jgi:hypothetical protein
LADTEVALKTCIRASTDTWRWRRVTMWTLIAWPRAESVFAALSHAELNIEFVIPAAPTWSAGATELAVMARHPRRSAARQRAVVARPLAFVATDHPVTATVKFACQLAEYPAILPGLGTYTGRIVADSLRAKHCRCIPRWQRTI